MNDLLNSAEFREQASKVSLLNKLLEEMNEIDESISNPEDIIIYSVVESGGSYDSLYDETIAIFSTKELAEQEKKRLEIIEFEEAQLAIMDNVYYESRHYHIGEYILNKQYEKR